MTAHPKTPGCPNLLPSRSSNTAPGSDPPRPTPTVPGGSHRSRGGQPVPPHAPTAWPPPSGRSCQPQWAPRGSGPLCLLLWSLHGLHRRREVTPRRHAIPQLKQVILQIPLKLLDRHAVNTGRALVGLDPQIRLPHHVLGNIKRFHL